VTKKNLLNNRKPFKLLAQFTEEELHAFRQDLEQLVGNSPSKRSQKFLVYLEQWCKLDAVHQPVSRTEFVAGTSLPASANAFDKLTSLFYNQLQVFLAKQELLGNPVAVQQLAFRAYRKRPFDWKEIQRRHGEAHRELDKLPQSSRLSHDRLILDLDLATLASSRTIPASERGYTDLLAALEADYVTQKLRLLCAIANDRKIFAAPTPEMAVAQSIPPYRSSWPPLARLYYAVYQLLTGEKDSSSMAQIRDILDEQDPESPDYPDEDMLDLYGYLLNALILNTNRGDQLALKELSILYGHLIKRQVLFENGMIAAGHFKNIISTKLKTGEIASARNIFEQFSSTVANDPEKNAVRYNHTLILHAERKLKAAMSELEALCAQTHNLKLDLFYGLDIRVNLLKVYYDLLKDPATDPILWDETEEKMVRLMESFKGYIERKKISKSYYDRYEMLRKLISSLYMISFRKDQDTAKDRLKEMLHDSQKEPNFGDAWIQSRISELAYAT